MSSRFSTGNEDISNLAFVESNVTKFSGEQTGVLHFFRQFPEVIFRCKGSVFPKIIVELSIAFIEGILAYLLFHQPQLFRGEASASAAAGNETRRSLSEAAVDGSLYGGGIEYQVDTGSSDEFVIKWNVSSQGHSLLGLLLGFLIVFRTQSGFNFYLEGQSHLTTLCKTLRNIAIEALGSMPKGGGTREQAELVMSVIRRLKLYYFAVVEHLRSNDNYEAWLDAHSTMLTYASAEEVKELDLEFGPPTQERELIAAPTDVDAADEKLLVAYDKLDETSRKSSMSLTDRISTSEKAKEARKKCADAVEQSSKGSRRRGSVMGTVAANITKDITRTRRRTTSAGSEDSESKRGSRAKKETSFRADSENSTGAASEASCSTRSPLKRSLTTQIREHTTKQHKLADFRYKDPTTSKPMLIALFIRRDVQRLAESGMLNPPQLAAFAGRVDDLIQSYLHMHKIDQLILPLPYAQLLKVFILFFVNTVPFAIAPTVGILTPFVSVCLAAGYFGLDQLGAELENPFGTGENDLPLLAFGTDLSRNLDTLVRAMQRDVVRRADVARHRRAASEEDVLGLGGRSSPSQVLFANDADERSQKRADAEPSQPKSDDGLAEGSAGALSGRPSLLNA